MIVRIEVEIVVEERQFEETDVRNDVVSVSFFFTVEAGYGSCRVTINRDVLVEVGGV